MARTRAAGTLTDMRRDHGARLVDCGAPVMRMAYRVTMRATPQPSRLRVWLWPGRWCRRGSGRGVVGDHGRSRKHVAIEVPGVKGAMRAHDRPEIGANPVANRLLVE